MKHTLISLLVLFLFGCSSTQVAEPPVAIQSHDQKDSDHDGVINTRDFCPETPLRAVVDNDGCASYVDREEENNVRVLFANDSSIIPDNFLAEVTRMSDFLNKYPDTYIELKGYASPVGRHEYNVKLSQRRAAEVRKQLIASGVVPERIQTVGFGDLDPITSSSKQTTNTLSRRVVAKVVGAKGYPIEEWTIFTLRDN